MRVLSGLGGRAARTAAHTVFSTRRWTDSVVRSVAAGTHGKRVLEIGSGRQDFGSEAYSVRRFFDDSNEFVQSDVNPGFGWRVVDVTTMDIDREFDLVICMYVLEHVYDVAAAVANLRRCLREGGQALVAVPHVYPYHDEPTDFWRFTEHSLRLLFADFSAVDVQSRGLRRLPKGLAVTATRPRSTEP